MKDLDELDDDELIEEYRRTVEFRAVESAEGQVTPHEIELRQALERELLRRMD